MSNYSRMYESIKDLVIGEKALEPGYPISEPNVDIPLWNGEFEYCTHDTPNVFKGKGRANARLLPSPATRFIFESNMRYGIYPNNKPRDELRLGPIGTTMSEDRVLLDFISPYNNAR